MTGMPAARRRRTAAFFARAPRPTSWPPLSASLIRHHGLHLYARGIALVIVNGRMVINDVEHTGDLPGGVLRPASG
jgi:hypothetical protein